MWRDLDRKKGLFPQLICIGGLFAGETSPSVIRMNLGVFNKALLYQLVMFCCSLATMGGCYRCYNAAADIESSDYFHPTWLGSLYKIIKYLISNRLVKSPLVPERPEIEF